VDAGVATQTTNQAGGAKTPAELCAREATEARRFFRTDGSGAGGWRVAGAGWEALAGGAYVQRRDFPFWAVEFIAAGRGRAELGGLGQALAAGRVYATTPETRLGLRGEAGRGLRRYYLWLDGSGAEARIEAAGLGRPRVRVTAAAGEIRDAWEWLLREGTRPGAAGAELARALAEVLLLKLADARDAGGLDEAEGARESFERCRALADGEAARLRGAAELAGAAGLRVETLCRLFRRYADTTPGAYLRMRRVRLAGERLRLPGARVKQVAAELGFADAFHFSRVFKAELGVTPRAWRARAETGGVL
jgi:AraC-like DNA-binding protein